MILIFNYLNGRIVQQPYETEFIWHKVTFLNRFQIAHSVVSDPQNRHFP